MIDYVWLIPVFPLVGFLINGFLGKRLPKNLVGVIGSLAIGLSFALTCSIFYEYLKLPVNARPGGESSLSGSTKRPFRFTRKSRCGPVESPVEPTYPITSPCSTRVPLRIPFANRERCP